MTYKFSFIVLLCSLTFASRSQVSAQPANIGDTLIVSLDQAVDRALHQSQEVKIGKAQADLAESQVTSARSALLPQLSVSGGYVRTLASIFNTGGFTMPDSLKFSPDPNLPLEQRVGYLEDKTPLAAFGALGSMFSDLPFGRENVYQYGFSGSQVLYSGGRILGSLNIARKVQNAAELGLQETRAQVELDVRTAYYQALLAREMVTISEAALQQAERFLSDEQLRMKAGRASDLEVMRAEVALENMRPQLIQATNGESLALLNLKRLLNVPYEIPLKLTTRLEPPDEVVEISNAEVYTSLLLQRPALMAAEENVAIRRQAVTLAKGSFLPSVALQTAYGRQMYPTSLFSFDQDWRTDWTVTLGVQIPIFQGMGRLAQVQQARIELDQARMQMEQMREAIQLQYEQASGEKDRARAVIDARKKVIDQAQRVYDLTVMRYEKGLATQLDVSDSRLALLQARTYYAQALADYNIADAQVKRALGVNTPVQL